MFSSFIFKDVQDIQGVGQIILYNLQVYLILLSVYIYQIYIIIKDKYF